MTREMDTQQLAELVGRGFYGPKTRDILNSPDKKNKRVFETATDYINARAQQFYRNSYTGNLIEARQDPIALRLQTPNRTHTEVGNSTTLPDGLNINELYKQSQQIQIAFHVEGAARHLAQGKIKEAKQETLEAEKLVKGYGKLHTRAKTATGIAAASLALAACAQPLETYVPPTQVAHETQAPSPTETLLAPNENEVVSLGLKSEVLFGAEAMNQPEVGIYIKSAYDGLKAYYEDQVGLEGYLIEPFTINVDGTLSGGRQSDLVFPFLRFQAPNGDVTMAQIVFVNNQAGALPLEPGVQTDQNGNEVGVHTLEGEVIFTTPYTLEELQAMTQEEIDSLDVRFTPWGNEGPFTPVSGAKLAKVIYAGNPTVPAATATPNASPTGTATSEPTSEPSPTFQPTLRPTVTPRPSPTEKPDPTPVPDEYYLLQPTVNRDLFSDSTYRSFGADVQARIEDKIAGLKIFAGGTAAVTYLGREVASETHPKGALVFGFTTRGVSYVFKTSYADIDGSADEISPINVNLLVQGDLYLLNFVGLEQEPNLDEISSDSNSVLYQEMSPVEQSSLKAFFNGQGFLGNNNQLQDLSKYIVTFQIDKSQSQ